jgi:Pvc16 N-terminal domain
MSNILAIAAVTEALVNLLDKYLPAAGVNGAQVAHVRPDQKELPVPGINVFLYQVTPNTALRNADLPTRAPDGTLLRRPQAALDLHYLLTFYGNDKEFEPQRLLGAATLALHAHPVLTRDLIQPVPMGGGASADSHLASQSELVRITPIAFSLEELSKLWSFLLKIDYVLSAAYVASVVLIEEDAAVPTVLPARAFRVGVQPMRLPVIIQVAPWQAGPILAQSDIVLRGHNLAAPAGGTTQVLIDGTPVTPADVTATSIRLTLPAGLAAGAQTAQVIEPLILGSPPVLHPGAGVTSNVAAFVLSPRIAPSSPPGSYAITVIPVFGSPPGPAIAVGVIPTARAGQRVLLLLQSGAGTRLFDGGVLGADADTVPVPIPGLANGDYLLSVLVDGAESAPAPVTIAL